MRTRSARSAKSRGVRVAKTQIKVKTKKATEQRGVTLMNTKSFDPRASWESSVHLLVESLEDYALRNRNRKRPRVEPEDLQW